MNLGNLDQTLNTVLAVIVGYQALMILAAASAGVRSVDRLGDNYRAAFLGVLAGIGLFIIGGAMLLLVARIDDHVAFCGSLVLYFLSPLASFVVARAFVPTEPSRNDWVS